MDIEGVKRDLSPSATSNMRIESTPTPGAGLAPVHSDTAEGIQGVSVSTGLMQRS